MSKQSIGQRIKSFRLERGWNQDRLANFLGISKSTVVRLERGEKCIELTRVKIERRLAETQVAA